MTAYRSFFVHAAASAPASDAPDPAAVAAAAVDETVTAAALHQD